MAGALIGALACGRCGFELGARTAFCLYCGTPIEAAAPGSSVTTDLLYGTRTAESTRVIGAIAIDSAPPVVLVVSAGTIIVTVPHGAAIATALLLIALAYLSLNAWSLTTRGSSTGRAMLSLRTVDALTATPASLWRFLTGTVSVDLRKGRDPLAAAYASLPAGYLRSTASAMTAENTAIPRPTSAQSRVATEQPQARTTQEAPRRAASVALLFDTGQRYLLSDSLIIGRNPQLQPPYEHMHSYAWPDLSRTLSKTHLMLEWDGQSLWVTDLNSTNGTRLVDARGGAVELKPGERTNVPAGNSVAPGDRALTFDHRGGGA